MSVVTPNSGEQTAEFLLDSQNAKRTVEVIGNGTKRNWGGPANPCDNTLQTTGINRLINYERNDLTVSVEAGMPFAELQMTLAQQGQMLALDPPYAADATVGGLLGADCSGAMRRQYGTLRDLVIGMTFATLDGKLISSGGSVVKNVAGLDMCKVLIGSFGTLAVIVSVNFRVHPIPEDLRTFIYSRPDLEAVLARKDDLLKSPLHPIAIDLLNPAASKWIGLGGYVLAVRAAGSKRSMARYCNDLADCQQIEGQDEKRFWASIQEFPGDFLRQNAAGFFFRFRTRSKEISDLMRLVSDPLVCRCGSGFAFVHVDSLDRAQTLREEATRRKWYGVAEAMAKANWQNPSFPWLEIDLRHGETSFATMKNVKTLFDPDGLLNPLRLYGRI